MSSTVAVNTISFSAIPNVAQKEILKSLSAKDITLFAMNTPKNVQNCLAFLTRKVSAETIDLDFEREEIIVKFYNSAENFNVFFNQKTTASSSNSTIHLNATDVARTMLNVVSTILHLYQGPIGKVVVDLKKFDECTWSRLEGLCCGTLIVNGATRKVKKTDVSRVTSSIKARKEILIESDLGSFRPTLEAPLDRLIMKNSSGLNGATLLKTIGKAKHVELEESGLEAKDINNFLKAWMNGTERTTTFLKVSREDEERWNLSMILKGLPTSRYQPETRDRQFVVERTTEGLPLATLPLQHGMDIRRADGLLGTLGHFGSTIAFGVWHQEHEIKELMFSAETRKMQLEERLHQAVETYRNNEQEINENIALVENYREQMRKIEEKDEKDQTLGDRYHKRSLELDIERLEASHQELFGQLTSQQKQMMELSVKLDKAMAELLDYANFL